VFQGVRALTNRARVILRNLRGIDSQKSQEYTQVEAGIEIEEEVLEMHGFSNGFSIG
jgi:hypothetical protein